MWVLSLGREDPLEEVMATHSSILAWEIPWTEEHGGLQSIGPKELDTTEPAHACMHAFTYPNVSAWSSHSHANDSYLF